MRALGPAVEIAILPTRFPPFLASQHQRYFSSILLECPLTSESHKSRSLNRTFRIDDEVGSQLSRELYSAYVFEDVVRIPQAGKRACKTLKKLLSLEFHSINFGRDISRRLYAITVLECAPTAG